MACSHKHDGLPPRQWSPPQGQDLRWTCSFSGCNCRPKHEQWEYFSIDFLLKYAILDLVGNCVWVRELVYLRAPKAPAFLFWRPFESEL